MPLMLLEKIPHLWQQIVGNLPRHLLKEERESKGYISRQYFKHHSARIELNPPGGTYGQDTVPSDTTHPS